MPCESDFWINMKWSWHSRLLTAAFICIKLAEAMTVKTTEGEKLQVVCEYNYRYKLHNKYFCRHPCNSDNDVLVLSSKPETLVTRGRFHLFDYSSNCNIRVTVDNVQLTDTGTYYCGIEVSLRLDRFTQVFIKVEKGPSTMVTPVWTTQQHSGVTAESTRSSVWTESLPPSSAYTQSPDPETTQKPTRAETTEVWVPLGIALAAVVFLFLLTVLMLSQIKKNRKATGELCPTHLNVARWFLLSWIQEYFLYSGIGQWKSHKYIQDPSPLYEEILDSASVNNNDIVYSSVVFH
ncbi:CMRF35-like molecule 6 [Erpetoichthys calabaricus]|uniref:CMRF35-like molecule 6 n=1 Tax=Erpetoichthys calabaricus TaxID=27687 RepID=UPI00223466E8|nr:CMRF35-like molecule 6 [Erpetoichthys calabaricus]